MTNVYSPALLSHLGLRDLSHLGLRDFPWFGTDQGHWQLEQKKKKWQAINQNLSQPN
jgi:hypothetical protein